MAELDIYLKAVLKEGKPCLMLHDSEGDEGENDLKSKAKPGDIVTWTAEANDDENTLEIIKFKIKRDKSKGKNIFGFRGLRRISKTEIRGKVSKKMKEKEFEKYNIIYQAKGIKETIFVDPTIEITRKRTNNNEEDED